MTMKLCWTLVSCTLVFGHVTEAVLKIGAFNIQRLSQNKVEDEGVVQQLAQVRGHSHALHRQDQLELSTILIRYDVASIEEAIHVEAVQTVLQEMNRLGGPYSMTVSAALGRSSYKEHLVIVYRPDKVSLVNNITYPDVDDNFERPPYSALFRTTQSSLTTFGLMGIHLRPADVRVEINFVDDAYRHAVSQFHTQNFIITGDFNADCRYLSNSAYQHSDLSTDNTFSYLISKDADTTTKESTNCAYDRFVVTQAARAAVVSGSVTIYNFETDMHLTEQQALAISDHFPIELQLQ